MLYYVRALYDFEAGTSDELPCPEGAILAVVEDIFEEWYEAEYEGLRGMVPKTYCEVIKDPSKLPVVPKLNQIVVVMYNYEGQDSDELRVQEGDVLQILDDSDSDWYVAKPVSKAGRPGLIPKSFCQPPEDSQSSPTESRGKKAQETMERKEEEKRREDERRRREEESRMDKIITGKTDMVGYANDSVEKAKVTAYEKRSDRKYWYVVEVQSAAGKKNIYRTYQDFYDFHTKLMDAFPDEAGDGDVERIIPFLPGQRLFVNENVAKQRRTDLDVYCSELLRLPPRIVRSKMLVNFFASRPSDEAAQAQGNRGGSNGGSKNQEPSPALPARRPDQSNKSGLPPAPWSLDGARSRSASNSNLSQAAQKPDRPFSVAPRATNSPVARAKSIARSSVARNGPVQGGYNVPARGGYVSGLAVGKPLKVVPTAGAAGFASNSFSSSATGAPIPNPKPYATPTPAYSAPKAFSPAPTYAAPRAFGSSTPSSEPYRSSPVAKPSSASLPKPPTSQKAGAPPLAIKPSFGKIATQSFPPPSSSSFSNPSGATVVVKVHHKQEIVSFMVSPDTAYAQLKDTAFKKLGIPPKPLQFKDEDGDLVTINGDDDLFMAFQANPSKIFLYVP